MTGQQLLEKLEALSEEDRKLEVVCTYWESGEADQSGWDKYNALGEHLYVHKSIEKLAVEKVRDYSQEKRAINLE